MSKRKEPPARIRRGHDAKRPRTSDTANADSNTVHKPKLENVTSAKQLERLLQYERESVEELVTNHKSVRKFLIAIESPPEEDDGIDRIALLTEYLESQNSQYEHRKRKLKIAGNQQDQDAEKPNLLPDLFQTWAYSASNFHDQLFSVATSVFYYLLKVLSSSLELSRFGQTLCQSLLQYGHAKVISRGMASPPHKRHLSGPCLQLMAEVVSFDGGAVARQVYLKKDMLLDPVALGRNLNAVTRVQEDDGTITTRPSIRPDAVRYVLANFKFQKSDAKSELLKHGPIVRSLFDHVVDDAPQLAVEILDTVRKYILRDHNVDRSSRTFMLTNKALSHIARLFSSEDVQGRSPVDAAYDFLALACTSVVEGTLYDSSGWYSHQREGAEEVDTSFQLLALENEASYAPPIRNTKIANFLRGLRPWSNPHEQRLTIYVFENCPELVADFFPKMTNFSFDPKLTATWIGYSSFLFSSVQLQIPKYFGRRQAFDRAPPSIDVILENVLPAPLNQKVIVKCFHHNEELITLFAVRLIIISLQKLQKILTMFHSAASLSSSTSSTWERSASALVSQYCERCPPFKEVITVFFKTPVENILQREAITRLLALYYRVVPELTEEAFEVSKPLVESLAAVTSLVVSENLHQLRLFELQHLLEIARDSGSAKWWQKPEVLEYTPCTTLLQILTSSTLDGPIRQQIESLAFAILKDNSIINPNTGGKSERALISSIRKIQDTEDQRHAVLSFLDNCIGRLVRRPVAYSDAYEEIAEVGPDATHSDCIISLIWLVILEQWPYLADRKENMAIATWIASFQQLSINAGEDVTVLNKITKKMLNTSTNESQRSAIAAALSSPKLSHTAVHKLLDPEAFSDEGSNVTAPSVSSPPADEPNPRFDIAPPSPATFEAPSHRILHRDPEETLASTSDIQQLILSFCAPTQSTRLASLSLLQSFTTHLSTASSYSETPHIVLLLSEFLETIRSSLHDDPIPCVISSFTISALKVQMDPNHPLYPKINKFLMRAPSWNVLGLISYWTKNIFRKEASVDEAGARNREIVWLFEWIFEGLATRDDTELMRLSPAIPQFLNEWNVLRRGGREREVLAKVLLRLSRVEGGRDVLRRKFGVRGWVEMQLGPEKERLGSKGVDKKGEESAALWWSGGELSDLERAMLGELKEKLG